MSKTALLALSIVTFLSAQSVPGTAEGRRIETADCESPDKADRKGCNDKCADVVCPSGDGICDGGQICDSSTGNCVDLADPPVGTPCETGDLCSDDVCDGSGACVATGTGVVCAGGDGCAGGETCNPDTGACQPASPEPDGTACDLDGSMCTVDQCVAGVCTSISNVICDPGDGICFRPGKCDPVTGTCSPSLPESPGTPCNQDNDLCTIDACNGVGVCINNGAVTCGNPACETCNATTGTCDPNPAMCAGFNCGTDSCGNSCGTCAPGSFCDGNPGLCAFE